VYLGDQYWKYRPTEMRENMKTGKINVPGYGGGRQGSPDSGSLAERGDLGFLPPVALSSAILETAGALVVVLDRQGGIVYFNKACESVSGYSLCDLTEKPMWDILLPADEVEDYKTAFDRLVAGAPTNYSVNNLLTKDGRTRLIRWSNSSLCDAGGSIEYIVGTGVDITEIKRAEKLLLDCASKFRELFQESPVAIFAADFSHVKLFIDDLRSSGVDDIEAYIDQNPEELYHCATLAKMLDANKGALELYETESREELQAGVPGLVTEGDYTMFRDTIVSFSRGIHFLEHDVVVHTLKGKTKFAHLRISIGESRADTWSRVLVSLSDVTELKLMEEKTRLQRDLALELAGSSSLDEVAQIAVRHLMRVAAIDSASTYLCDEVTGAIDLALFEGRSEQFAEAVKHFDASSDVVSVVVRGKPVYFDHQHLPLDVDDLLKVEGILSFGIIPILHEGNVLACFAAGSHTVNEIPPSSRAILEAFAAELGGSVMRLRSEEALRISEQNLQIIFDSIPGLVFFKDKENRIVRANKIFCEAMGMSEEEITGRPLEEIFPDQSEGYWKDDLEVIESGQPKLGINEPMDTLEGTKWLQTDKVPYRNAEGEIVGVIGMSVDITERKRAEEAMRESEALYRSLIEISPDVITVVDLKGNVIAVSQRAIELTGYSEEEIRGENAVLFVVPEGQEKGQRLFKEILDNGAIQDAECTIRRKDGAQRIVGASGTVIPDKDGNPQAVMLIIHDITEHKRAEEALRESELKYRTLLQSLNEGIWAVDTQYTITFANERLAEMLGYAVEEMIGQSLFSFIDEQYIVDSLFYLKRTMHGVKEERYLKFLKKDRSNLYASVHLSPMFDADGNTTGVLAAVLDITDRKVEEGRRQLTVQLLELLNRSGGKTDKIGEILHIVKEFTGIEAIGLRLKKGDQFPFYHTEGFPGSIDTDGADISALVESGRTLSDLEGEPVLQCICSDIIRGEISTPQPFFTDAGSFWTNSMTEFLGSEQGKTFQQRSQECLGRAGYESIAIVPLQSSEGVLGFMQLEDCRADMFTEDDTHFLEEIGESIGLTLARREAEDRYTSERERYLQHFQNSSDMIYSVGPGPKFLTISPSVETVLGYKPEELVGKLLIMLDVIAPESQQRFVFDTLSVLSGEDTVPSEYVFMAKDGTRKVAEVRSTPLVENGEIIGLVGVARDITERKKLEEERKWINEELERRVVERTVQLEEANKELEAFSYSVSHDLRAPLRAIDGFTNMLSDEYSQVMDEEGQRLLSIICQNTEFMGELIDHMLTLSRVGRREMVTVEVDMNELVQRVIEDLKPTTDGRNVAFLVKDLPPVQGDSTMCLQVLMNLLSNAIKFTGKKEAAVIEVGYRPGRNQNTFFVKDNGAGFDMQYTDRLFGVFQRMHSSEDFEGVGVGLALVKRIVKRHGGTVWAEGEKEKGATFYFTLPAR
jgi:PAS domain S-box-containing protein